MMEHTVPSEPIVGFTLTSLRQSYIYVFMHVEPLIPKRIIDDVLTDCRLDYVDVVRMVHYFVLALLFFFLFYHNEHRSMSLFDICLTFNLQKIRFIHEFEQDSAFMENKTIDLLLNSLLFDEWVYLKGETIHL